LSAAPLSFPTTLELLLTPSVPLNGACPDPVEAPSVPGVYPDLVEALIPAVFFDFQLLTFNFQPSNLQTFKRLRASSFPFISFADPHPLSPLAATLMHFPASDTKDLRHS
jgi:hypothetical protein